MGRTSKSKEPKDTKTKVIDKDESPEPEIKSQKKGKSSQPPKIFTDSFYERVDTFSNLVKDLLEQMAEVESVDVNKQLGGVMSSISTKIEENSARILETALEEYKNWIKTSQAKLEQEIIKIKETIASVKENLETLNVFSEGEVRKQLSPLEGKISEKESTLKDLSALLTRIEEIKN